MIGGWGVERNDAIRIHDEQAAEYDQQARDYKWFGHDLLFGMSFEYVSSHESLLDIGIGTGLSSQAFAEVGLDIFGIDGSVEMLNICKSKGFAKEIKLFDLKSGPLPYPDSSFNHAVSCGVFHIFGDLEVLFGEVSRVVKPGGIFAFTTLLHVSGRDEQAEGYSESSAFEAEARAFLHSDRYIEELLKHHGFEKVKELKFMASSGLGDLDDLLCKAYVARRSGT
jgi:predicted TPR repeat methyltransferase